MNKHFCRAYVTRKIWDRDDDYLAVEICEQVEEQDGFEEGDEVKITIEKVAKTT